jgi:hypothetical protein
MKLMKRSGNYAASNVVFDPKSIQAWSYGHWKFVTKINSKVIFNNYRYSVSTSKHQHKVYRLMSQLGIKVDIFVNARPSLSEHSFNECAKSAIRSGDDVTYLKLCKVFEDSLGSVREQELVVEREEAICDMFLENSIRRQEKKEREAFLARVKTLEAYLENDCAFRDYDIVGRAAFGDPENKYATKIAVHQCVDLESMEHDVQNALHSFSRDGFGSVVFYV